VGFHLAVHLCMVMVGVVREFWGSVYDERFLRPSKQGLRARLNGLLVVNHFLVYWLFCCGFERTGTWLDAGYFSGDHQAKNMTGRRISFVKVYFLYAIRAFLYYHYFTG